MRIEERAIESWACCSRPLRLLGDEGFDDVDDALLYDHPGSDPWK